MYFRPSTTSDLEPIMAIIRQAQENFRRNGIDQWQNGYPNETVILADIDARRSYVVCNDEDRIIATAMVTFDGDPNYRVIYGGEWVTDGRSYAAIHRIAVSESLKCSGIATFIIRQVEQMCRQRKCPSIRIDTHHMNIPMQRLTAKCGFVRCGIIHLADGAERLAYEKIIEQ